MRACVTHDIRDPRVSVYICVYIAVETTSMRDKLYEVLLFAVFSDQEMGTW